MAWMADLPPERRSQGCGGTRQGLLEVSERGWAVDIEEDRVAGRNRAGGVAAGRTAPQAGENEVKNPLLLYPVSPPSCSRSSSIFRENPWESDERVNCILLPSNGKPQWYSELTLWPMCKWLIY